MKKILSLLAFSIITFSTVWGQINTLYFNKNVYQSTELNPARQHNCRFAFGLPAMSSIYLNTRHTGFSYADLFYEDATKPDTARFVPNIDGVYKTMGNLNYVFLHNKTSLGYVAFWIRDFYITFDVNLNVQQNLTYPKAIFSLKDGNYFTDGRYISLTGFSEDLNIYTEYALGVSKEVSPGLVIGGKLKLLKGISNFTTKKFQFDWHVMTEDTAIYDYRFNSSFEFRASSPIKIAPEYDADGNIIGIIDNADQYSTDLNTLIDAGDYMGVKKFLKPKNTGLAVDLGVIYKPSEKFELSASVVDLGFISWKTNPMIIKTDASEFTYSGFDLGKYIGDISIAKSLMDGETRDSILGLVQSDMLDTLISLSNPSFDSTKYINKLNTQLHFGGAYTPTDWVSLGFLYNGYFYHKKLISSYSLISTLTFWRGWSYTVSYTMFKHSFNNLGMGLSYKIGPFQTYLLMDNLSIPTLGARYGLNDEKPYDQGIASKWVKNTQMLNFQFGINFMFGCRDRRDFGVID